MFVCRMKEPREGGGRGVGEGALGNRQMVRSTKKLRVILNIGQEGNKTTMMSCPGLNILDITSVLGKIQANTSYKCVKSSRHGA